MRDIIVSGSFSDINSRLFRFLQEAGKQGRVRALLWSDALTERLEGAAPRFSQAERQYMFGALRYVDSLVVVDDLDGPHHLPPGVAGHATWVVSEDMHHPERQKFCVAHGLGYNVIPEANLAGFPERESDPLVPGRKTVLVTGCFDWFHSGHVRFFEEVSEHGHLYVVVGHDANLRLLKGEGHPLFPQAERRYMVQSARCVTQAFVSTGHGWMDAEPEVERLKPDAYAVNEDGDRPEKRDFCARHGLEYIVLKREPKSGLVRRTSTDLRGF